MQTRAKKLCSRGGLALLLGALLSLSAFLTPGQAYAQGTGVAGKVIMVSLSKQWLYAYQDGTQVYSTAVMTGRPALPTPTGTYHVFLKLSPTTFYSPFPQGSPYWYAPTFIHYALEWRAGGFFLHDSWWHSVYGPGTNGWHDDPTYGWQWGSHGCVSMSLRDAAWLYNWTPIGTTVQINP
jgi:lipoprotein-anchoring transpeptidase ErfK/SrfK